MSIDHCGDILQLFAYEPANFRIRVSQLGHEAYHMYYHSQRKRKSVIHPGIGRNCLAFFYNFVFILSRVATLEILEILCVLRIRT